MLLYFSHTPSQYHIVPFSILINISSVSYLIVLHQVMRYQKNLTFIALPLLLPSMLSITITPLLFIISINPSFEVVIMPYPPLVSDKLISYQWKDIPCVVLLFNGVMTLISIITLSYDIIKLLNKPVAWILLSLHLPYYSVVDICKRQCGLWLQLLINVSAILESTEASLIILIVFLLVVYLFLLRVDNYKGIFINS